MSSAALVRRVPYPVRDNHKHCAKCGKLVSRAAYACRRCGKRQRIRPKTILLLLSACLMVGMFAVASAGVVLTPGRAPDSAAAPVAGGALPSPGVTPSQPAEAVDASALLMAYSQGAAAGDRRFKDRPLLVTGTVRSVERDFEGRLVVRLSSGESFETVNARMALRNDPAATVVAKGRRVSLACVGRGVLIGAPLLGDCSVR